jgi:hypothetical protein
VYWILALKSNQIQIKSKSCRILIWILKDFFLSGFGFGFDLKYCLKSKSNPNPFMKIFFTDVASKLRPETHSFSLFSYFPRLGYGPTSINLLEREDVKGKGRKADENQVVHPRSEAL